MVVSRVRTGAGLNYLDKTKFGGAGKAVLYKDEVYVHRTIPYPCHSPVPSGKYTGNNAAMGTRQTCTVAYWSQVPASPKP